MSESIMCVLSWAEQDVSPDVRQKPLHLVKTASTRDDGGDNNEEVGMGDALLLLRAAASWLASVVTVGSAMLLRADSDGPAPRWPTVIAAMAVLAVLFWPMTKTRRRLPGFAAALIALQLSGHAFLLYAATGQVAHSGATGLFCCPSTPYAAHGGLVASLTANAGWVLLLVQLLVVAALSVPLRLLHTAFLELGQALATVLRAAVPVLAGLLKLLAFAPSTTPDPVRPRPPVRLAGSGRHVAGAVRRRGPPRGALVRSSTPHSLSRAACA
jgi:hypothetical protein